MRCFRATHDRSARTHRAGEVGPSTTRKTVVAPLQCLAFLGLVGPEEGERADGDRGGRQGV